MNSQLTLGMILGDAKIVPNWPEKIIKNQGPKFKN